MRPWRGVDLSVGYARDRNNRDDAATGRLTLGGYLSDLFSSGLDVTYSDARIERPFGPYHSRYLSVGHAVSRSVYVSGDYASSLALVRFVRSDGVVIETKPWSRRWSGNVSATLGRQFSIIGVLDITRDEGLTDYRVMAGLTYRLR